MQNVTMSIDYASIYYANFVSMWTMTFQNRRNRKHGTPLIDYAIRGKDQSMRPHSNKKSYKKNIFNLKRMCKESCINKNVQK